eukprot:GHVT01025789.1.p1 GENE.GHVT01025789.1~~GHVT01025789.1.p1  ORF type:complete len:400 (-),score=70.72 GHVT01025789.1:618-1817(-)
MYEGQWEDNQAHGLGVFCHNDGDVFVGTWEENSIRGLGVLFMPNDDQKRKAQRLGGDVEAYCDIVKLQVPTYAGEWAKDMQNGYGVINNKSEPLLWAGEVRSGRPYGMGEVQLPSGGEVLGRWSAKMISGFGVATREGGARYRGGFKSGRFMGHGQLLVPDGNSYVGEWFLDDKEGFGVLRWNNGAEYEGFWHAGLQHGQGRLRMKTRYRLARWANGEPKEFLSDWKPIKSAKGIDGVGLTFSPMPEFDFGPAKGRGRGGAKASPRKPRKPKQAVATPEQALEEPPDVRDDYRAREEPGRSRQAANDKRRDDRGNSDVTPERNTTEQILQSNLDNRSRHNENFGNSSRSRVPSRKRDNASSHKHELHSLPSQSGKSEMSQPVFTPDGDRSEEDADNLTG